MARNYVFNSAASPQTGVGDGLGAWYLVRGKTGTARTGQVADTETINVVITGTMSGVTIKPVIAHDMTSPLVYANAQNPKDDGTVTDVSFTTTGSFNLVLPSGCYFTLNISGSGSPLPAVNVMVRGEVEAV